MKATWVYVGIRVQDLQKSIEFYTTLLGMKVTTRSKIEETKGEVVYLESEPSGFRLELNYYANDSPYATDYVVGDGLDHLAFKVDNLDAALHEARVAGYPMIQEIKSGSSRWAYIEDPNGIWIELYEAS